MQEHPRAAHVPDGTRRRLARHYATHRIAPIRGKSGLSGGGNGDGAAPVRQGPNYDPAFPEGALVAMTDGFGNIFLAHSLARLLVGNSAGPADSCATARCASARAAIVAKYYLGPNSELESHVRRRIIAEELGGGPGEWGVLFWPGGDSGSAESEWSGGRCARNLHTARPPGHYVPV